MTELSLQTICIVAVWSSVNVAGIRLSDMDPKLGTGEESDKWEKVHHEVINRLGHHLLKFTIYRGASV